jgi:hypothetical protein
VVDERVLEKFIDFTHKVYCATDGASAKRVRGFQKKLRHECYRLGFEPSLALKKPHIPYPHVRSETEKNVLTRARPEPGVVQIYTEEEPVRNALENALRGAGFKVGRDWHALRIKTDERDVEATLEKLEQAMKAFPSRSQKATKQRPPEGRSR